MNDPIEVSTPPPASPAPPVAVRALSKRQIKAAEVESEYLVQKKWKLVLPEAKLAWAKVPAEELANSKGNVHVLAGLVQLRYQISRQDADQQVQQFLLKHLSLPLPAAVPTSARS